MKHPPSFGHVRVDGYCLAYRVEGEGRPVMVLGSSVYYPRTFSNRLRDGHRLGFIDLRHFAKREQVNDVIAGLDTYIGDIELLRARLGFERFTVIGHSHHGNVAIEYARQFPGRVSHLVLIGTPPCDVHATLAEGRSYWNRHASPGRKRILRARESSLDDVPRTGREAFVRQYVADGPRYWFEPAFDASPLWRDVPVDIAALESFKRFFMDYEFPLSTLNSIPVLVATGLHDYVVPPTLWPLRLSNAGNVTYRRFDRSGHTPQLEEPERFNAELERWLRRR